jgi:long-subunit fatty acid transport protein
VALGGAYSFLDDMMAVSLGARLVIPRRSFVMEAEYTGGPIVKAEYEYNALGVTPILGFDIRPIENLTIGLRYEFKTSLEFEYEEKELSVTGGSSPSTVKGAMQQILAGNKIADGNKFHSDLPHIIAAGVEYELLPGLALDLSGTVYLLPQVDLNGIEDHFTVGYDAGLGASWKISDQLKLGAGFSYTESGAKQSYFDEQVLNASANPPLDSITLGLGGTYSFGFGLDINLGALYCHYLPVDYKAIGRTPPPANTEINIEGTNKKDVIILGLGVSYHY